MASPSILSNTRAVKKFIPPLSNSGGPSENPHKLDLEGESTPTHDDKLSIITNQPSSHWTANWYIPR